MYLIENESAQGIGEMLRRVLTQSDEVLFEKGREARDFILQKKNNVLQAEKILAMLR